MGSSNTAVKGRRSHSLHLLLWGGSCSAAGLHCWLAASQHQQILVLHTAGRKGGAAEQVLNVSSVRRLRNILDEIGIEHRGTR